MLLDLTLDSMDLEASDVDWILPGCSSAIVDSLLMCESRGSVSRVP